MHLGVVHDVHEVTYQLLCLHHEAAQLRQAGELVLELGLIHRVYQFRHVFEYVKGARADFLVVQALRPETRNVLHRELVEFLDGGHAHRIEFHLLLLGGDGIQTLVMLVFYQFL